MSQRWGNFEEFDLEESLRNVDQWYHIPTLVVVLAFMLWVRAKGYSKFVDGNRVLFSANDPWYHFRTTAYTVEHWPRTMPFDPWTYFAFGTSSAQFGTLFDQLIATAALIVGLGDPSQQTVAMTFLLAPAVFGALVAIPVFIAARRMGGRLGAVVALIILALSTGGFLERSLVGFTDHHVAEALFQMTAIAAMMIAISVAEEEMPVWELVANREWDAVRRPAGWAALAGIAIGLYIWVWPPAAILVAILGAYFVVQLSTDYLKGRSPDHLAFIGIVALTVAGLLSFVPMNTVDITGPVEFSILQPLLAFAVAFGCGFMAWLARQWDSRDVDRRLYPVAVGALILVAFGVLRVAMPGLFDLLLANIERVFLGTGAEAGTVGEAQPLPNPVVLLFFHYGFAYIVALVGGLLVVFDQVRSDEPNGEMLLVVVWGLMITLMTLNQSRFEYYLVLPIAVLSAYVIRALVHAVATEGADIRDIEVFQVLTILIVILVIIAPLTVATGQGASTVITQSERNAPSTGVTGWDSSLQWMEGNTPRPGTLGGASNEMDHLGTYKNVPNHDYDQGAYGVISWWDYGHWITTRANRIPNANPFQQGSTNAANFLLAPNESQAEEVLSRFDEDDAQTRYVMVDWKMVNLWPRANGKFFAPIQFYNDANVSQSDFYLSPFQFRGTQGRPAYYVRSQRFYESMVNRLWYFHGSAAQPRPVVVNYDLRQLPSGEPVPTIARGDQQRVLTFQNLSAARAFVEEDGSAQVGGVGPNPPERVSALEHYRLVHNAETTALQRGSPYAFSVQREARGLNMTSIQQVQQLFFPDGASPPWVKVFERVPGATIEGSGPPNANVTAVVQMRAPNTNSTFRYVQRAQTDENGEFTMTVPYSTTGYDNFGPENGYTNTTVRAAGPYQFGTSISQNETGALVSHTAIANVTEAQVIGEDDSPVEVELQRQVLANPGGSNNSTSGGSAEGSSSGDDSSEGTNSTDGSGSVATGGAADPSERVVSP